MNNTTILEIKPKNAKPKGFSMFLWYFFIVLGLPSFFVGGFILVIIGVMVLFILPKHIQKKYPVSYVLTQDCLICNYQGVLGDIEGEGLKISWDNIESLYLISFHWAAPKQLGIRLRDFEGFRQFMLQHKVSGFRKIFWAFNNLFYANKHIATLGRRKAKCDIMIPYLSIDRSAEDFAQLLYLHMEHSGLIDQIV